MRAAGVPVTPGSEGNLKDLDDALVLADEIGYPVMLKATSGGGGRGIRRCDSADELRTQYPRVISEATKGVRQRRSVSGKVHRQSAPYRGADSRRQRRQCDSSVRARLLHPAT